VQGRGEQGALSDRVGLTLAGLAVEVVDVWTDERGGS